MIDPKSQIPNPKSSNRKIAIACDWLIGGGAENVVYELHKIYPQAPIYTSYCSPEWRKKLSAAKIRTSYLQHWPFPGLRKYVPYLRAMWFSRLKLKGFDVVISASGAEAKAVGVPNGTHICYTHAPTHYYWSKYRDYLRNPGFGIFNWPARIGLKILAKPMRRWDYASAQLPDILVANSNYTKNQIQKYYQRESTVIYPPVDTENFAKFAAEAQERKGFVIVSRQTPYKKIDLAVKACSNFNLPLTVIGNGPEHEYLKSIAGPSVKFIGQFTGADKLAKIVGSAEAFLFPGTEDFGIAPVEALAGGTPVIAYKGGGALDYVKPGVNGEFFKPQTYEALARAISSFDYGKYAAGDIKASAKDFSNSEFRRKITKLVDSL